MHGFLNRERARRLLQERQVDALLVTSPPSLQYVTGLPAWYTADNVLVFILERLAPSAAVISADAQISLVTPQSAYEFAQAEADFDRFYGTRSSMHMERAEPVPVAADSYGDALALAIRDAGARTVAVESMHLSMEIYEHLKKALPGVTFSLQGNAILQDLKIHKSPREIEQLRRATDLNIHAMLPSLDALRAGVSERELHRIVKGVLQAGGGCWNQTTIGAGINGAVPYHIPDHTVLKDGDFVRYDIGGMLDGFSSDLARVAAVGKVDPAHVRLYETLLAGEESAIALVKPGTTFAEIFRQGMEYVWKHGYPEYRRGNIGHTIGIELEEEPFIGPNDHRPVEPGMVLAIELPWYSIQHSFGFNAEDIVLVTETGCEILSAALPRGLYYR